MSYAETGRYPLFIAIYKRIITYWLKVVQRGDKSLIGVAYHELEQHNGTWASKVKNLLYNAGFGEVWENKGVDYVQIYFNIYAQRCIDMYMYMQKVLQKLITVVDVDYLKS